MAEIILNCPNCQRQLHVPENLLRGEGITNAGRICGMIATIIAIVGCTLYGIIFMIAAMSGGLR